LYFHFFSCFFVDFSLLFHDFITVKSSRFRLALIPPVICVTRGRACVDGLLIGPTAVRPVVWTFWFVQGAPPVGTAAM